MTTTYTAASLAAATSSSSSATPPLLMALCGKVYDVSSAPEHYGRGGPYNSFVGRDASRALAIMKIHCEDTHIDDLTSEQQKTLLQWDKKISAKYPCIGMFQSPHSSLSSSSSSASASASASASSLKSML
jgi:membrane-associated progesterone receptor component